MKKLLYIILIIIFFACVKEDIIEINNTDDFNELSIFSLLSPQSDSILVFITNVSPLDQIFNHKELQNGSVIISGNNKSFTLKRIEENPSVYACASKDFEITKGSTYELNINIPGYQTISAKTKIPDKFSTWISPAEPIPGILFKFNKYYKNYAFRSGWNKSEYGFNYFSKRIYGVRFNHKKVEFDSLGNFIIYPENTDSIPLTATESSSMFEKDISTPGDSSSITINVSAGYSNKDNDLWKRPAVFYSGITYYIYTVDKKISDYIQLLNQYKDPPWSDAMPIEPHIDYILPSFSNIEGGYGLFGSYGYDSVYFDLTNLQNFYGDN